MFRAMERATLEAMLDAAIGVDRDGEQYKVREGYRLSLYVGQPGQAMEVSEVLAVRFGTRFCEATSGEHRAVYYLEYNDLHGLSVRPPSGGAGRRAGFS